MIYAFSKSDVMITERDAASIVKGFNERIFEPILDRDSKDVHGWIDNGHFMMYELYRPGTFNKVSISLNKNRDYDDVLFLSLDGVFANIILRIDEIKLLDLSLEISWRHFLERGCDEPLHSNIGTISLRIKEPKSEKKPEESDPKLNEAWIKNLDLWDDLILKQAKQVDAFLDAKIKGIMHEENAKIVIKNLDSVCEGLLKDCVKLLSLNVDKSTLGSFYNLLGRVVGLRSLMIKISRKTPISETILQ